MALLESPVGPLKGIRVLEICHMLAGPYCGMLMADLGAEVIKIEYGDGDIARAVGPDYVGDHNVYFSSLNRNKKSVLLDLAGGEGWKTFEGLVATADVLITNLRPRAIRKLGLTYDRLKQINERIVCLALTGFGLEGPRSESPAYDYVIQALAGVMMLTGEPNGPPMRAGYSVVDNTGGMMGVIGVLAKIVEGQGGQIDVALYDILLSQLNYLAASCLNGGEPPMRLPSGGHAHMVPAQIFSAREGFLAIFISHDSFWASFAKAVGRPDWVEDPRFATMAARQQNRTHVVSEVQALLNGKTSDEWVELLQPLGIVVAGVRTLAEALDSGEVEARRMIASIPTAAGVIRLVANPVKIEGFREQYTEPPLLGQHTAEVTAMLK